VKNVALNVPESEKKIDKRFHANSIEKLKIENLATLQRLELLLKRFQQKPRKIQKIHENFLRSTVCVFTLPVRASHVIQGRPTKNYSVDCVQGNHHLFLVYLEFSFAGKMSTFFGPPSAKTWGKMAETPDDSQNFYSPPHWQLEGKKKKKTDHQRNLIRENSFIYYRAVDRTSRSSFSSDQKK
jgi:hypothetical protein